MKSEIRVFIGSAEYNRFTSYETWLNISLTNVKEVKSLNEKLSIESSICSSATVFRVFFQAKNGSISFVKIVAAVGFGDYIFHGKQVTDRFEKPLHVCKNQFQLDFKEVPLTEKQMDIFGGLQTIEWFCNIVRSEEGPFIRQVTSPSPIVASVEKDQISTDCDCFASETP